MTKVAHYSDYSGGEVEITVRPHGAQPEAFKLTGKYHTVRLENNREVESIDSWAVGQSLIASDAYSANINFAPNDDGVYYTMQTLPKETKVVNEMELLIELNDDMESQLTFRKARLKHYLDEDGNLWVEGREDSVPLDWKVLVTVARGDWKYVRYIG